MSCRAVLIFVALTFALVLPAAASGSTGRNVLVVVNGRHPQSAVVAARYRALRGVPEDQVVVLDVEASDQISRADFVARIEQPLTRWFDSAAAHDRITYIVLMPGFPVRVAGTVGRTGTVASVDSELALLYRTMVGGQSGTAGPVRNPYFTEAPVEGQWPAFDRGRLDVYLVTRLDGFTGEDVLALLGRCEAATPGGRFVLDDRAPLEVREHRWFTAAASRLTEAVGADRVVLDRTPSTVRDEADVVGFYSWGTADPGLRHRRVPLTFRPGAIAASLASTDGRTFTAPPDTWRPGSWQARDSFYKGSPEWLIADLVRSGLTGVAGNVADPYGDSAVRPDVLFPAYAAGRTLGEAMYLATPSLGWQTLIVGDPLCRPFGTAAESPAEFTIHEASGLTQPFFDRKLAQVTGRATAYPREAVAAGLAATARVTRGELDRALEILATLTASHPTYVPGLVMRAQTLDSAKQKQPAIDAYRAVLAVAPNDIIALNNLAYLLVEEPNGTQEALTLARRAYELTKGMGMVADTFGWVLFRAGDAPQAERVLRDAVAKQPGLAELRVHLARVLLVRGQLVEAREQWERAISLAPAMRDHAHAAPLVETFPVRKQPGQ